MSAKGTPKYRHGLYHDPLYSVWEGMIQRCTNPKHSGFHNYGGRGITVCDRWRDVVNFHADMAPRPPGLYLDRIDNDGPYEPGNCRWITMQEQHANRRHFPDRVKRGCVWLKP